MKKILVLLFFTFLSFLNLSAQSEEIGVDSVCSNLTSIYGGEKMRIMISELNLYGSASMQSENVIIIFIRTGKYKDQITILTNPGNLFIEIPESKFLKIILFFEEKISK